MRTCAPNDTQQKAAAQSIAKVQLLVNAVTVHVGTGTNLSGLRTNQELAANCLSFCQSVAQTPCRNIGVEIYGYFAPLIACVLANHDVVGMTVLVS